MSDRQTLAAPSDQGSGGARGAALSGGALVLAAIVGWNLGNYAFFLIAGRLLGPADYGLLAALLAAVVAASVPANALAMEVARLISGPRPGAARALYARSWRVASVVGLVVLALGGLVLLGASQGLEIPAGELVITLAAIVMFGPLFLSLGILQGEHRFSSYATAFALMGVPRPILLLPLAALGLGIYAGLGATALAIAIALGVGAVLTWPDLKTAEERQPGALAEFGRALLPIVVGLLGVGVLTNSDIIAAQASFSADDAGVFAAVAVLAKAVILPPQAASIVLLPRVAARTSRDTPAGELLALGVLIAIVSAAAGALIGALAGDEIMRLTFGESFESGGGLLAGFAAASATLGALLILLNHHVARRKTPFLWTMGGLAVVYVMALLIWHSSATEIIVVGAVVGAVGIVLHEIIYFGQPESVIGGSALLAKGALSAARRARARSSGTAGE